MSVERAFLVSGLEVTTSLVLETEFNGTLYDNGFAIGSCFIIASPFILLGLEAKKWLAPPTLVGLRAPARTCEEDREECPPP